MGPVGEGLMVLTTQPGRVDWNFVPRSEEGLPPEVRFVGTFVDTVDLFSQIMGRWLGNAPALVRLAFGAIVHQPVQDKAEAYRYLAKSLPAVNLDVENSEDFIYQINRPRQSTVVQGLKINRLGKWSAALFLGVRFDMTKQMISRHLAGGEYTCRLELDINTDALFPGELPGTQLHAVFEELKNLGMEMADRGDVA